MGTILEKLDYTYYHIAKAKKNWSNTTKGAFPISSNLSLFANTLTESNLNNIGYWYCFDANATANNVEAGKTFFNGTGKQTGTLVPKAGNLVNSVTFEGTYATSTYYNANNSGCCINPDTGVCIIYVTGGTSVSYESIRFDKTSIPTGAVWGPQSYYEDSSMDLGCLYSVLISNITYPVDVVCNFSSRNASYDYVYADVTITKA